MSIATARPTSRSRKQHAEGDRSRVSSPATAAPARRRSLLARAGLAAVLVAALALGGCGGDEERTLSAEEHAYWTDQLGRWHEGGWRELTPGEEDSISVAQRQEIERLRSIGYLTGSTAPPANKGVTVYDAARAYEGLNFYTSGHQPGATLMDMEGNILHEWRYLFIHAWDRYPGEELPPNNKSIGYWRRAHPLPNGDVIAIFEGVGIIKVDKDSNLIWANFNSAHHDLEVMPDGTIYTLTRKAHIVPRINEDKPILEDFVTVLDENGREIRSFSLLEAFEDSPDSALLAGMKPAGDIFHTNTIEILDDTLEGEVPGFEEGNALVCMRETGIIATVDLEDERVEWALTGPWEAQHQPTVLPDGNMMLFDNRGANGASRVIVFDPRTEKALWVYRGKSQGSFFSNECGSAAVLPNGNVLITESDRGKAFEVTQDKEIVWKYINPAQAGEDREFIATIFEMVRLDGDYGADWLGG